MKSDMTFEDMTEIKQPDETGRDMDADLSAVLPVVEDEARQPAHGVDQGNATPDHSPVEDELTLDPCNVDTDGDTLTDCEEERIGSNPMRADTDYDGLTDSEEVALGTHPLDGDSDDDFLTDLEEHMSGTDPLNADTDGDAMDDGEEVRLGLSPLHQSSFDHGVLDGDLAIHSACAQPEPEEVRFDDGVYAHRNWRIALPMAFTRSEPVEFLKPEDLSGAQVYDMQDDHGVAGFALSVPTLDFLPLPELITPYQVELASLGTLVQHTTSPYFRSRHGFRTRTATFDVMLDSPMSLLEWRNHVLLTFADISPHVLAQPLPLDAQGAQRFTRFFIQLSVIERNDHSVVMASIIPREHHDPHSSTGRFFSWSADATNISMSGSSQELQCSTIHLTDGRIQLRIPPISATLRVYRSTPNGRAMEWVPPSREHGYAYDAPTNSIMLFGDYRMTPDSLGSCTTDTECPDLERCAHQRCIARQPQHYAIHSSIFWAPKWPHYF